MVESSEDRSQLDTPVALNGCVCRKLDSAILMMKPSENRAGCDGADAVNNPMNGSIQV
jgi:hypothetical protein